MSLDDGAFASCGFTVISLPEIVEVIGENCFANCD